MAVIKVSLFAEQERETRLDKIGDALSKLAEHVDFAALAAEIDEAAPPSSTSLRPESGWKLCRNRTLGLFSARTL